MRYKYIFSHHLSHLPGDGVVWLPVALVPPGAPGSPAPPAHPLTALTGELPLTAGVDLGAAAHAAALNIHAAALVSRLANTSLSPDVRLTPGHLAACSCDGVSAALQHLSSLCRHFSFRYFSGGAQLAALLFTRLFTGRALFREW